jgi:hypothetical protein
VESVTAGLLAGAPIPLLKPLDEDVILVPAGFGPPLPKLKPDEDMELAARGSGSRPAQLSTSPVPRS